MQPSKTKPTVRQMTCDICGRVRPEDKVDDEVADLSEEAGIGLSYVGMVVSHCTDSEECRIKAECIVENYRKWLKERQAEKPFCMTKLTKGK